MKDRLKDRLLNYLTNIRYWFLVLSGNLALNAIGSSFRKYRNMIIGKTIAFIVLTMSQVVYANDDLQEEVRELLNLGYMPDAIIYDQIAKGNALHAIANAAAGVDRQREAEFRYLSQYIAMGALPRTACGGSYPSAGEKWISITYDDLSEKSVSEVANIYFDGGVVLALLEDGRSHGPFSVSELADIAATSSEWYDILPVRNHPVQNAVFVSIYKETESISVDGNLGRLAEAEARGDQTIPVVFHYYPEGVLPVGSIESDQVGLEVIDLFKSDSVRISPPPNWKSGDYHLMMSMDDMEDVFDIPDKEDIDDDIWDAIEADLSANGFIFPIIVQMAAGKASIEVFGSKERASVARDLGINNIPLVYFYEPIPENGINADCFRLIRGEDTQLASFFAPNFSGNHGGPPSPPTPPPPPTPPVPPPPPVTP